MDDNQILTPVTIAKKKTNTKIDVNKSKRFLHVENDRQMFDLIKLCFKNKYHNLTNRYSFVKESMFFSI